MLCTLRAGRSRAGCCEIVATTRVSRGVPKSPRKREREIFSTIAQYQTTLTPTHHLWGLEPCSRARFCRKRARRVEAESMVVYNTRGSQPPSRAI